MQIQPEWHSSILYKIQNKELGKILLKRKSQGKRINHTNYFRKIGYNLHAAGYIYRAWLDKYGQNYPFMLSAYLAGPNHKITKSLIRDPGLLYKSDNRVYSDIRDILE